MRVYGPYLRKDGRKHVIKIYPDGKRQTQSYPRYLLEQHLGIVLPRDKDVDHINEDKTDNRIENFDLLDRVENAKKTATFRPPAMYTFVCPECEQMCSKKLRDVKRSLKKNRGPFCSKKCAGAANGRLGWRHHEE